MFEAFRSWRCKTGCAALAAGIVLVIGWIRSYVIADILELDVGPTVHIVRTSSGTIQYWATSAPRFAIGYTFRSVPRRGFQAYTPWPREFEAATPSGDSIELTFPLWLLVVPTLLISANLLLRKSRQIRSSPVYAVDDDADSI
jgi:hypothetical protein